MGGCATKENKENKPAEEADGCVSRAGIHLWYQLCLSAFVFSRSLNNFLAFKIDYIGTFSFKYKIWP